MNNKISRRSFMKTASLLGFGGAFLNVAGAVTNVPSGVLRFGPAEAFSFDALIEHMMLEDLKNYCD